LILCLFDSPIYAVSLMSFYFALIYIFLKDDIIPWKKHKDFTNLNSEQLIELVGKLKMNRRMLMIECSAIIASLFLIFTYLIDILDIEIPQLIALVVPPIYLFSLLIYRLKIRIRKSIEIFKTAERMN